MVAGGKHLGQHFLHPILILCKVAATFCVLETSLLFSFSRTVRWRQSIGQNLSRMTYVCTFSHGERTVMYDKTATIAPTGNYQT